MRLYLKWGGYVPDLTGNKPGDVFQEALVNRLIWAIDSGLIDDEDSDADADGEEKTDEEKNQEDEKSEEKKKLRQQKIDEIKRRLL